MLIVLCFLWREDCISCWNSSHLLHMSYMNVTCIFTVTHFNIYKIHEQDKNILLMLEKSLVMGWLDFILGYYEQSYWTLLDVYLHGQTWVKPKNKETEGMCGLIDDYHCSSKDITWVYHFRCRISPVVSHLCHHV